ncbi:MAG: threonylcarbamoyl-AMP synthase [Clostridia bacterium]|nr:threonylcarbamoyl-AMP synthase [Clostridia bacterium]
METLLLTPTEENLALAARALREGQLVGMPTETVYGLGADALNVEAVHAIFAAKGRPADNPLIVHVPSIEAAEPLCHIDERSRRVLEHFCPGPLTLLLPKKPVIPQVVNAGLPSVAIRIPSHPVARRLLELSGVPVAAPSANTSGKPSPTNAQHVFDDLQGKLHSIIDGGSCQVGLESTVVDMTREVPTVLRPGGITPDMLLSVLDEVAVADSVLRPLQKGEKALSPGMLYKHYAPKGTLTLVKGDAEKVQQLIRRLYAEAEADSRTVQILTFEEHLPAYEGRNVKCIGSLREPETIARQLFAVLRQADAEGIDILYSEVLPPEGVGLAVMNRLSRAAGFRTLDADQEG